MAHELKKYFCDVLDYVVHEFDQASKTQPPTPVKQQEVRIFKQLITELKSHIAAFTQPDFNRFTVPVTDEHVVLMYQYLKDVCLYLDEQLKSQYAGGYTQEVLIFHQQVSALYLVCLAVVQKAAVPVVEPVVAPEPVIASKMPADLPNAVQDVAHGEEKSVKLWKKIALIVANILFYVFLLVSVVGFILVSDDGVSREPTNVAGFSVMTVLTGSMEGNLPGSIRRNSVIILRHRNPDDLEIGMVATYRRPNGSTWTHRIIDITYNEGGTRSFRLQGDANVTADPLVDEIDMLGNIVFQSYVLGMVLAFIRFSPLLTVALITLYLLLISTLKNYYKIKKERLASGEAVGTLKFDVYLKNLFKRQEKKLDEPELDIDDEDEIETDVAKPKKRFKLTTTNVVMTVLLGVIIFSGVQLLQIYLTYREINQLNEEIRSAFVTTRGTGERPPEDLPDDDTVYDVGHGRDLLLIDWEGLQERNEDVVAWIHVPGTNINYPILEGATNDTYLRLDIDRNWSVAGSIFLEENNNNDFKDGNTIIYGHNMLNGVKFSEIDDMVRGSLTDVTYIYVYLPNGMVNIYMIASVQLTDIWSEIYHLPVTDMPHFYYLMLHENRWENVPDELLDHIYETGEFPRVITLSTCAEAAVTPIRSVVFGILVEEILADE